MLPETKDDFSKEDYINALDNLSKLHAAAMEEIKELRSRCDALKDVIADMRGAPSGFQRDIESLVAARYAFKSGNTSDGMYELEKVLGHVDGSWRTRCA